MKFTNLKEFVSFFENLTIEKASKFYKITGLALVIQDGKVIGFTK